MKVVAENIQFLGAPGGGPGGGGQSSPGGAPRAQGNRPAPSRQAPPAPDHEMGGNDGPPPEDLDIQEESVPF